MKRHWPVVALIAGGVLLGGPHGALADRQQDRTDQGVRSVRDDWQPVRNREKVVRHERRVEVRDDRCDHPGYRVAQPFAYVRVVDPGRVSHRDCR